MRRLNEIKILLSLTLSVIISIIIVHGLIAYAGSEAISGRTPVYSVNRERPCFAEDLGVGNTSIAVARAYVSGDYVAGGNGSVRDLLADGKYVAAHFIFRVDGIAKANLWFGVPDGGSVSVTFSPVEGSTSTVISEGYFGILDSRAEATALWTRWCPLGVAQK